MSGPARPWARMVEAQEARRAGNPLRVYVAASESIQDQARNVAAELRRHGVVVTSRWIDWDMGDLSEKTLREGAEVDLADLRASEGVLLLNHQSSTSGGMHFECGFAAALGLWIWVLEGFDGDGGQVKTSRNPFHYTGKVRRFPTVEAWAEAMRLTEVSP